MNDSTKRSHLQTAAEHLAAATLDLFPNTLLVGGEGTSKIFYYDFIFPFPLTKETLSLIEERMARRLKEKTPIKKREMLASNAAQLFKARGQFQIAEALNKVQEHLIQICEIDGFVDYCPMPFSKEWPDTPFFKLFEFEEFSSQDKTTTRIFGVLAEDKASLKYFLKTSSSITSNHLHFIEKTKLFQSHGTGVWSWLPKGEILRQLMIQWWRQHLVKENFKFISTPYPTAKAPERALYQHHQDCFANTGHAHLAEIAYFPLEGKRCNGLLEPKGAFTDRFLHFSSEENFLNDCISSLHFILKMPRILGFEFQVVLGLSLTKGAQGNRAKRTERHCHLRAALEKAGLDYVQVKDNREDREAWIDIRISDALGRLWDGPFIAIPNGQAALVCSAFGAMERFVALILERHAGQVPLWLSPEQVRLLPLTEGARQYAHRVHHRLISEGIRCEVDAEMVDLGKRLYQAIEEKIPFAVIIGDREVKAETLVVRTLGKSEEEHMPLNTLCERIKTVNREWNSESEN